MTVKQAVSIRFIRIDTCPCSYSLISHRKEEGAVEVRNCSSFVSKLRLQVSFVGSSSVKLITATRIPEKPERVQDDSSADAQVVAVAQEVLLPVGSLATSSRAACLIHNSLA